VDTGGTRDFANANLLIVGIAGNPGVVGGENAGASGGWKVWDKPREPLTKSPACGHRPA